MNVLVTGGAGFIGSHLVEKLLLHNHNVVCIDNFDGFYERRIKENNIKQSLKNPRFKLLELDIRNYEDILKVFNEHLFDVVYHLAAKAGVRSSIDNPFIYEDVNIRGSINLLECVKKFPVSNFVFASSSSIYGINNKIPFSEEDKVEHLISPYAVTKRTIELLSFTYHHLYNIPITCLRFFTVYGPRQRPDMAIHKFTRAILNNVEITLYGDGSSKRDYTYIDDVVESMYALLNKKFKFEIFNIGNSKVIELSYLISVIERITRKKAKIKWLPTQLGDVPATYSDLTKANKYFGYFPKTNIEEGIQKFVNWYIKEMD